MTFGIFIINSALLGFGLAMDAFSVSLVNGMLEPQMRRRYKVRIAGIFAVFQFLMPMTGWLCVHTLVEKFEAFEKAVPWIALVLLLYIGGKMILEAYRERVEERIKAESGMQDRPGNAAETEADASAVSSDGTERAPVHTSFFTLIVQGVATSIDALSVGFTIAPYSAPEAALCSLIIGAVTYVICSTGIRLGIRFGTKISGGAQTLGGVILIAIGLEIFLKSMFFGG